MSVIVWVLALLNLSLIGIVFFLLRRSRASTVVNHRSSLEEAKQFIVEELDRGTNVNVLRRSLLDQKWPVEVVEQAFREVGY